MEMTGQNCYWFIQTGRTENFRKLQGFAQDDVKLLYMYIQASSSAILKSNNQFRSTG
ncbi:hypothetical protein K2173_012579 [Erythroxylum novogranatense]|uniref:Uncharacterized protein n=1 Tax=Erythroxylum novogranatense TaxID=1862640 RepID=A0AAV8S671_9ROSI|nr:hypothetical protein K2173_012579 [Erythroxylum novogranatense]